MSETTRVTLIFPSDLWEEVKQMVPAGKRSRMVVEALEIEIQRRKRLAQVKRLREFQQYLFDKYGEMSSSVEELNQMRKERDVKITSVR